MFYRIAAFIFFIFFKVIFRLKVVGRENIPKEGSILICSNHIHNLDPILLGVSTFRIRQIFFMAKAELFRNKPMILLLRKLGAFPVSRGTSDRGALKEATKVLREQKCLGLFPEGKRSKDGILQKGMPGAAMFSLKNNAPVIPVAIIGNYKLFQPIKIVFGKPVNLEQHRNKPLTSEVTLEATTLIMDDIQTLLLKNK